MEKIEERQEESRGRERRNREKKEGSGGRQEEGREARPMRVEEGSGGDRKGRVGQRLRESRLVGGYDQVLHH